MLGLILLLLLLLLKLLSRTRRLSQTLQVIDMGAITYTTQLCGYER
jgi:hypothetical protein